MNFSAVLLAGGKSRRMGQDKATIVFRGAPLWQTQLDLLRKLQPHEIFVSARIDPAWRPPNVTFVADQQPSRGPLSGIAAALGRTLSDHLLALAIDMPFMTARYLRQLLDNVQVGCGIVPMIDDRAEPLAAVYPRGADVDLHAALTSGDFSLQSAVQKLIAAGKMQSLDIATKERSLFRNLNQPADLD